MEVKRVWLAFGAGAALGLWLYVGVFRPSMDLPHCIPRFPGGLAFRFGLARDVLHERYPIVTKAEYENSIKDYNSQEISTLPLESPALGRSGISGIDDIGVALDKLGRQPEAVALMRSKLARQLKMGRKGRELYTTYANLGTFLVHGAFKSALSGDPHAKQQMREGLSWVRRSIEVNPQAHFGREHWQAVAIEFLLAAMEEPALLKSYDMVGDSLEAMPPPRSRLAVSDPVGWRQLRPEVEQMTALTLTLREDKVRQMNSMMGGAESDSEPYSESRERDLQRRRLRDFIPRVGAERGWAEAVRSSHNGSVPFDEPVLGILGMWWLGGGPNPHFALALGGVFERVGDLPLAWEAYERGALMADKFWPDPELRKFLVQHCRTRQSLIEGVLGSKERLRADFDRGMEEGKAFRSQFTDREIYYKHLPPVVADERDRMALYSLLEGMGWSLCMGLLAAGVATSSISPWQGTRSWNHRR